jgi:hypothetical protein
LWFVDDYHGILAREVKCFSIEAVERRTKMTGRNVLIAGLLLVLTAAVLVEHTRTSQAAARTSWEYRMVKEPGVLEVKSLAVSDLMQANERMLNDLGSDGWELVSHEPNTGIYILKRQR